MIAKTDTFAADLTADHDRRNLEDIGRALAEHRINEEAAEYMRTLYSDGMDWFRDTYVVVGGRGFCLVDLRQSGTSCPSHLRCL